MTGEEEKRIMIEISEHKKQAKIMYDDLQKKRNERAKTIRDLYFKKGMKQTEISKQLKIRQGSVSRIISEYSCPEIERGRFYG